MTVSDRTWHQHCQAPHKTVTHYLLACNLFSIYLFLALNRCHLVKFHNRKKRGKKRATFDGLGFGFGNSGEG